MSEKVLRLAIIGGGKRCERILSLFEADKLRHLKAEVVAVADLNPDAPGYVKAAKAGLFTTRNYHDFFSIPDLDLVIELTGNESLLQQLIQHKPPHLRVLDLAMSRLCEDMIHFEAELQDREQKVQRADRYFKKLCSVVHDPIMVLNPDHTIEDVNQAFLDLVSMTRDEVLGRKCYEISHRSLHPCSGPEHECPLQMAIFQNAATHAVHEHPVSETESRYYDVLAYPLSTDDGQVLHILEIWRDVSNLLERQLAAKTIKMKEDLARLLHEDKMIALGKLVASAVHEINNPLAAIHTFGKVMLRMVKRANGRMSPEDLKEMEGFLDLLCSESRRCGDIVTNLLSFSRHKPMLQETLNLNDMLHKIIRLLKHKMELQNIQLMMELTTPLNHIHGDLNQLQQCLMNLIFNAIEAMPTGGRLNIRTLHDFEAGRVVVEIQDSGCGIPADHLPKIFEPFFSTKVHEKGIGLGLAVVYGIVKEHEGGISVESQEGEGTVFRISFPIARAPH